MRALELKKLTRRGRHRGILPSVAAFERQSSMNFLTQSVVHVAMAQASSAPLLEARSRVPPSDDVVLQFGNYLL